MMTYLLQVSLCWIVFYAIYLSFLDKETFFNINRFYLLLSLIAGLLIPYVGGLLPANTTSIEVYETIRQIEIVETTGVITETTSGLHWKTGLIFLYGLGVLLVFARFMYGLIRIGKLFMQGDKTTRGSYVLVSTVDFHLPFSFFHYVFISQKLPLKKDIEKVLKHEELHVTQWHSLDIVLLELLQVFFWFNPVLSFYKKSIRQSHEYLADAYVTKEHNKNSYGQLLLRQSISGLEVALANQFFHSQIKKRIKMMYKKKSKRPAMVKYLTAIPVLVGLLIVFASSNIDENSTDLGQTITVNQDPVLKQVEEMPRFPGCDDVEGTVKEKEKCAQTKMLNFIYKNLTYPESAKKAGIEGMCVVKFVVDKNGGISEANIVRDIGGDCGQASLNAIKAMPKWIPGKQDGKAVRVEYTIPIKFKLQESQRKNSEVTSIPP